MSSEIKFFNEKPNSNSLGIEHPSYYHRNFKNDLIRRSKEQNVQTEQCKRVTLLILPFFSLYKPLSFPISIVTGTMRIYTSISKIDENISKNESTLKMIDSLLQTAIAVASLAGTFFIHPLGMLMTTGHDLAIEWMELIHHLRTSEYEKALLTILEIFNNAFYLILFFNGGIQLAITSLTLQILVELSNARIEFKKGTNDSEGIAHLVMSVVRANQLRNPPEVPSE